MAGGKPKKRFYNEIRISVSHGKKETIHFPQADSGLEPDRVGVHQQKNEHFGKLRNKPKYQESMPTKTFCFNSVVPIMKKQRFAIPLLSRIL